MIAANLRVTSAPVNADLHCHSHFSDGMLSPADVVRRAHANGVDMLGLTDHDELSGLAEGRAMAETLGMQFVDGVEISISWGDDQTVHVLGLGVNAQNAALQAGLVKVRSGRDKRAEDMAAELAKVGIRGAYEGALRFAGNPAMISRAHFARYIVEQGHAKDIKTVFDHWLAKDKPGYVTHVWATLADSVAWIVGAGGTAVLAHPGRYRLTRAQRRSLFAEFHESGGRGLEVLSGSQAPDEARELAGVCREFGFLASRGSDFHGPGESWMDLGKMPELPPDLTPVWTAWM
jgi:predicted metal-dependent phosphoesterase TrpH